MGTCVWHSCYDATQTVDTPDQGTCVGGLVMLPIPASYPDLEYLDEIPGFWAHQGVNSGWMISLSPYIRKEIIFSYLV